MNISDKVAAIEHPIYFERMSDGVTWPACGCGEVQLMNDGRSADAWIAAHLASGAPCQRTQGCIKVEGHKSECTVLK